MRVALTLFLPQETTWEVDFFQLEDIRETQQRVSQTGGRVYSWKTAGKYNWLESGFSIVDVLGLVILPNNLPEMIQMPNDPAGSI